jgi:hypothetical protein
LSVIPTIEKHPTTKTILLAGEVARPLTGGNRRDLVLSKARAPGEVLVTIDLVAGAEFGRGHQDYQPVDPGSSPPAAAMADAYLDRASRRARRPRPISWLR